MTRVIPNQQTWVGFSATPPVSFTAPKAAEMTTATNITCFLSSLNASASGNAIPTPDLCTLFEKTIVGTSTATFTMDMYRDDTTDTAWALFPRNTKGYIYISRFGGDPAQLYKPVSTDKIEIWSIIVTSRTAGPLSSNTPQTFTVTCAVFQEPSEDVTVVP